MVEKFKDRHHKVPRKIVVAPYALVALGLKKSVGTEWDGIPVECRLFSDNEVVSRHDRNRAVSLGVFVKETRGRAVIRACDLKG